jgi:hypothetical protein
VREYFVSFGDAAELVVRVVEIERGEGGMVD